MLTIHYNSTKLPHQGVLRYVRKFLASNIALALIALPSGTANHYPEELSTNLIIPEEKLATSFNIPSEEESGIQLPVQFTYISQRFSLFHPGIDLPSKLGSPVQAIESGIVEETHYSLFGYGNEIIIDHGNGRKSLYAHLSKIEVKTGDQVKPTTEIGKIGSTGQSTGPHLHLEIYQDNKAINPLTVLPLAY